MANKIAEAYWTEILAALPATATVAATIAFRM